jgi:predicted permease
MYNDLRFALRTLRKNPGFTVVAVVTLALGIGANTAIFSLLETVVLRSLPVRDPAHLFVLKWNARRQPGHDNYNYSSFEPCFDDGTQTAASGCSFSYPFFKQIGSQAKVFSGVTAFAGPTQLALSGNGPAAMVSGELVSGEFFDTFGVKALLGRTLERGDDIPSAEPVAVLNYSYWKRTFGAAPSAVGKTIRLNGIPFTIVGVAEPGFTRLSPGSTHDLWLPLAMGARLSINWLRGVEDETSWWLEVVARTKPEFSPAQAQAAVGVLFRNEMLRGSQPLLKTDDDPVVRLIPAQNGLVGFREQFAKPLYVLMLAVGIVLLIACSNVGGLLLTRAKTQQNQIAVRLALGASRMRIVRQLLTEAALLAFAGGMLGIWVANWGAHSLATFVSTGALGQVHLEVQCNLPVLGFVLATTSLTVILSGLAPAFLSTQVNLMPALKESAGGVPAASFAGSRRFGLSGLLVVAQVALSILVLVGAGLLVRTLTKLKSIDPGFEPRNILLFGIDPKLNGYGETQIQTLYRDLQTRLTSLPSVISASYSSASLLSGSLWSGDIRVEGQDDNPTFVTNMLSVGTRFFETMQIPLMSGRTFTDADVDSGQLRAVVNRAFVRKFLVNKNVLGTRFSGRDPKAPLQEIIGVVGDAKYDTVKGEVQPTAYVPLRGSSAHFELRTVTNSSGLVLAIRQAVHDLDGNVPIFDVRTQAEQIDQLLFNEHLMARLSSLFGILALVLATVGLYGLLSHEVTRRGREIGIRMALGAGRPDVLGLVVGRGMVLTGIGVVLGLAASFAMTRYLSSLLYGVTPLDSTTFSAITVLLIAVALLACYIPARRATKVDPMVALRYE